MTIVKRSLVALFLIATTLNAQVTLKKASLIPMDSTFDALLSPSMVKKMDQFKREMNPIVLEKIGYCNRLMTAGTPESLLSNFLADQLLLKAVSLSATPVDVAIINLGGIRASLNKGPILIRDVYSLMPFENELVLLSLKGSDLKSIFQVIAQSGGEGLSGATLTISHKSISQLLIGGEPCREDSIYVVATMDYLADGNSGMKAFKNALKKQMTGLKVRDCYIDQIKRLTSKGQSVDEALDGRIRVID